jgi:hypothetical protein
MDETIEMMTDEAVEETSDAPESTDDALDLQAELESLRQRVDVAERTAREISAGWREFTELYPDADLSSLPDSFNADLERGIPPAAAYALEMRRREVRRVKIEAADRRGREMSSGRVSGKDDGLYSPDEVRAMSPAEVRQNMEKIRRSMKSWR